MYAVVGCSECSSLWVVEGRPERSSCPSCGASKQHAKRKKFVTTEDPDHAREVRAALLAKRQGHEDAFADLDSFAEMETYLDDAGVDDTEYLEASGVDVDEVEAAADRAESGRAGSGGGTRMETIRAALRELEEPTDDDVVEFATERGVPAEFVSETLQKLVHRGEVTEDRGTYRLL